MVAHSDEKYQCEEMSDCPYTGTTLIEKIPWGDCPADEPEVRNNQEEDQAEESDIDSEEDKEEEIIIEEPSVVSVQQRILNFEKMWSK